MTRGVTSFPFSSNLVIPAISANVLDNPFSSNTYKNTRSKIKTIC